MAILNREAILGAQDLKTEAVAVPEWGGEVLIRNMTGSERDAFTASMVDAQGKPNMANYSARLVSACIVGEDGERLFSDSDVGILAAKSAQALMRCFAVAQRLNGLGDGAVEAAEKN